MAKHKRTIDPALLPHPRPCWCSDCKQTYSKLWWKLDCNSTRYKVDYLHTCVMCGERFATLSSLSSYCSWQCQADSAVRIGFCIEDGCNRSFPAKGTRRRCDEHLKPMWRPEHKKMRELVSCKWCLKPFERIVEHESRICCSSDCLTGLKRQIRKYGTADRSLLPLCVVCYEPTFRDPRGTYCEYHSRRAGDQAKIADGRSNLKNAKRRSAAHDGDAGITVAKLRARDGDFCRACGFKIDFDAAQYDALAPEIDHIVPLAREGTHTWDNVQLLHGRCNRSKGARLISDRPTLFDEEIA